MKGKGKLMAGFESFELWYYAGILIMALAGMLLAVQTAVYFVKSRHIRQKLDEEYGQPQKYSIKGERN